LCLLLVAMESFSQGKGGRWRFENNGFDTADWDAVVNAGTLQGQAAYQSEIPIQEGNFYLWLDSLYVHDFFRVEDGDDLDFDNQNIGISAWIYPLKVGDDVHWIVNKGDQYPNPKTTNYALRISKQKELEFLIRDANNQAQTVASSFTIPVGQWTFVAAFYDYGTSKVYMWNDPTGGPIDTLDFNQDFFSNDDPLSIGSWYTSDPSLPSIKDFEGRIDDVRIGTEIGHIIGTDTGIYIQVGDSSPDRFQLAQNCPNPFNAQTTIVFYLNRDDRVALDIFNERGQRVGLLVDEILAQGRYIYSFDASGLPSGVYFYRLRSTQSTEVKRMLLMK